MKKLSFLVLLLPCLSYAFDTSVKGFIALDAFNYEKIEGKKAGAIVGIGVLDLKIFAEQDNMTAAMKLNLDGNLGDKYSLFEEAYASYRGIPGFRLSLGKGVVRFQNLHWGVVENTYYDGGSVLGSENSFRKLSEKAYASVSYGGKSKGFINTFWFWGDSREIAYDSQDAVIYSTSTTSDSSSSSKTTLTGYKTDNVVAFDTSKQTGLANKIELFNFGNWTLSNGLTYYKKSEAKRPTYAIDFGANYESADIEIWVDLLFGQTHKLPYEQYPTYSNDEYFLQVGFDKSITETWSWVSNAEYLYTNNQQWTYPSTVAITSTKSYTVDSNFTSRSGQLVKTKQYKLETGAKYKLSKTSFTTIGVLYENKRSSLNGVENLNYIKSASNPNRHAYKFSASVSFWF